MSGFADIPIAHIEDDSPPRAVSMVPEWAGSMSDEGSPLVDCGPDCLVAGRESTIWTEGCEPVYCPRCQRVRA